MLVELRKALAKLIYKPTCVLDTQITVRNFVAPEHENLAKVAADLFQAEMKIQLPEYSGFFSFRSPIDRMGQLISISGAAHLPDEIPPLASWDSFIVYHDISLFQDKQEVEKQVLFLTADLVARLVQKVKNASKQ
jgi:hypothetical protein